ncbi:MAG: hypothetical protein NXI25_04705 [bacterium]|nr:hypothetical protein [bacterium]
MVADEKIRNEIKDRVEKISSDKLNNLLEYVKALELPEKQTDNGVLRYFGVWSDIDEDLFEEFTERLPEKILQESKGNI